MSHRLAEVIEISQRRTVIRDGKLLVGVFPTSGMTQTRLGELMTRTKLVSTLFPNRSWMHIDRFRA